MGNIVYVYNKPFVSDFNALQLEHARILQMNHSNPTADGMSTPTAWQPPLPLDGPPPLPSSASTPTTPALPTDATQSLNINSYDPYHQFPVRRLDQDPSFSTPTQSRTTNPSIIYGTPPYVGFQQSYFGNQPSPFSNVARSVTKLPSEYIKAGALGDRGLTMSSSTYSLSRDENGQQFRSLQAAASDRRQNLNIIFSMFDMVYPYLAVDQDVSQLPLIFSNPFTTQIGEKLWHQTARVTAHFRNRAHHRRDGPFRLDHLGELAYQDGQCELYHLHAANLLEALRAVDLLKVVTAMAAGNFVLTIDEASTSLPRQMLDDVMSNIVQNSFVLIGSVTPFSMVVWEYLEATPSTVVTTVTAMQLIKMTSTLLEALSGFLQRDTLTAITGDITSVLHRRIEPTLPEILRKLLLYEETSQKEALRRKHLKRVMFQPLNTTSSQQAEKMWTDRKHDYERVFQTKAFPFIIEEFHELVGCLPQTLRRHADKLQEYYALHGFPSDIGDVFQRLRSLCDSSAINQIGRHGSRGHPRTRQHTVSFAGQDRNHGRHRPSHNVEQVSDVSEHWSHTRRSGYENGRPGDGNHRHDRDRSERYRGSSRYDKPARERDRYRSRSRSRSADSHGSQRSDLSRDYAHSRSRSPSDRSSWNYERDHRGRPDRLSRDHRDYRGRASSLDLATRRLRERGQGLDRGRPDRSQPDQRPGRQRTPPTSPRGNPSAELNAVQQPPPVKEAEPPRRSQSPSQTRSNLPGNLHHGNQLPQKSKRGRNADKR